jgi:hypothetical protein
MFQSGFQYENLKPSLQSMLDVLIYFEKPFCSLRASPITMSNINNPLLRCVVNQNVYLTISESVNYYYLSENYECLHEKSIFTNYMLSWQNIFFYHMMQSVS